MNVVEKYDDDHILFHMVVKTPIFVSNRDFVFYFVSKKLNEDRFIIINFGTEHSKIPPLRKNVRGFLTRIY